jgi:hypothetical protein
VGAKRAREPMTRAPVMVRRAMIAVVKKYRERLRFELEMMVGINAADDGFIKKQPLPSHRRLPFRVFDLSATRHGPTY